MKLIYIKTSYNTGITLPMEVLSIIPQMQFIKNDGYNELQNPTIDTEQSLHIHIIDSSMIGSKQRLLKNIKDAEDDLLAVQLQIEKLKELK